MNYLILLIRGAGMGWYKGATDESENEVRSVGAQRVLKRAKTVKAHAAIRDVILLNPRLRYKDIASLLRVSAWLVGTVAKEFGVSRKRGAGSTAFKKQKTKK
jgi:hypothetical protein